MTGSYYKRPGERDFEELRRIVGDEYVSTEEEELAANAIDAFPGEFHMPDVVVWPRDAEQVSRVLAYANRERIPVTVRAAGTGLSGCIPLYGGIVLNLTRMNKIKALAERDMVVVVEPGVVYERLNEELRKYGLFFPPDPGSALSCTVGGMVANNASGMRAVKYGVTRDYVLGLETVLPDGRIVKLGTRVFKTSIGPDLTRLMVGSEGVLGVFTEVTLRLRPLPRRAVTALAFFDKVTDATEAVYDIVRNGLDPAALEFISRRSIKAVSDFKNLNLPEADAMLIVELHGRDDYVVKHMHDVKEILDKHRAFEVRLAETEEERNNIWAARKGAYPALLKVSKSPLSGDIIVPISKITEMVEKSYEIASRYNLDFGIIGHIGDGNVHHIWFADRSEPDSWERAVKANDEIVRYAIEMGGAASAEHGIGIEKKKFMKLQHGEAYELLLKLKRFFDPNNILNPGIMFDVEEVLAAETIA